MNARFPRQVRVRARAEFDRAFQQGRRTASPLFSLHFLAGPPPARLNGDPMQHLLAIVFGTHMSGSQKRCVCVLHRHARGLLCINHSR